VNRTFVSFPVGDFEKTKQQMLNWANRFNICCFLDNHAYQFTPHSQECLLAAGAIRSLSTSAGIAFQELREFADQSQDWLFGHFSFDLKNETEKLSSSNPDPIGFPDLHFFVPKTIIELKPGGVRIGSCEPDHEKIFGELMASQPPRYSSHGNLSVRARFSHEEYLAAVQRLRQHIRMVIVMRSIFARNFMLKTHPSTRRGFMNG
jgi:para-aminobenzoate synthetase component 1